MTSSINNHSHFVLTLTFLLTSISLFSSVMGWILILVICAVIMRLALYFKLHKHAPSIRTLNLLALLSGIVLAYFSIQLGVLLGMLNLLVMASALKLMLLRNNRDYHQLITTVGFLIGCGFIFQQGILFSLIYLLLMIALILSLALHYSPSKSLLKTSKDISIMGIQAAPIALVLFLVMPKFDPLWQMPASRSSETGLSEKVTPGDIAKLSQSSDLVFRASFDSKIPDPQQRYWRAIVLEDFDGASWQVAGQRLAVRKQYRQYGKEFNASSIGDPFSYEVFAEPTHQKWLYAMDVAIPSGLASNKKIWQSQDYQLISKTPLVSTFQYSVKSYPETPLNESLFTLDRRINLQLPESGNPLTQQWVSKLRSKFADNNKFANAVMEYFRTEEFVYTLNPPLMPDNPVDTFLFDAKAGFCSHYASAMAYALRLGGIPARLVTGYQGGELRSDYLSIYQYDAHAWVEAWFDDKGWQRLDPTAAVAPDRIEYGLQAAVEQESFRFNSVSWLNDVRLMLGSMDYVWTKWVLGFDQEQQKDLFKSLIGELTPRKVALFAFSIFASIFILIALFYLPVWRKPEVDKSTSYYLKAQQLLKKMGISRANSKGPIDFSRQVANQTDKNISEPFTKLTKLHVIHLYRPDRPFEQKKHYTLMANELKKMKLALKNIR